jgi:hypothetical protein
MLFGDIVAVYCEKHTGQTDTLCGQNVEFLYLKAGGIHSDHWAELITVKQNNNFMNFNYIGYKK